MKNMILLIILAFLYGPSVQAQITRGNQPGELYIPSNWYYQGGQNNFDAIFYSNNNGELLEIKYIYNVGSGEMSIGKLVSDATDGVIYNNVNSLWISDDYADNWTFIEDVGIDKRYTSGCCEGEIYKYCKNPTSILYRSVNFGQVFEEVNFGVFGFPEVGTQEGELYILTGSTWPTFNIDLLFSTNFGSDFDTIEIDTTIAGYYLSGNFPVISRGSGNGEIYLVSWHLPSNYHIYYSNNYGESFELKYISEECNFYFENYYFTAGREAGTFYVVKQIPWYDGINTELYIYYSSDTAQSFSEYYHLLDENFPVNINEKKIISSNTILNTFPNPFRNETKIIISSEVYSKEAYIYINDFWGKTIKIISIINDGNIVWDGTDSRGKKVNGGIYFYSLIVNKIIISTNKLVFIN